ncbi:MAG: nuclear transport factor 2 family protein [Bacteroidota bacterium]
MQKKILLPCLLFASLSCLAQTDERAAVVGVIQKMFDAMRAGDGAAFRSTFDTSARVQTALITKEGKPMLHTEVISEFGIAVGTPHPEVWDERIWNYDVRIDGNLASAWTDYTFFLGEKMSHCGVNAFQLFKGENGWKIIQITDTRRRTNCQTEPNIGVADINRLLDAWHKAAAVADEDTFFGSMTADGIYLGTDATERWLRDELREWSKKYFEKETAWAFTPRNRQVYLSQSGDLAWFEELLDTWMGTCRGSGVLAKTAEGWKINHYNLAVMVPNDLIQGFIDLVKKAEKKD